MSIKYSEQRISVYCFVIFRGIYSLNDIFIYNIKGLHTWGRLHLRTFPPLNRFGLSWILENGSPTLRHLD